MPLLILVILASCSTVNPTSMATPVSTPVLQTATETQNAKSSATSTATFILSQNETIGTQAFTTDQPAELTLLTSYPQFCTQLNAPREFSPDILWMIEPCYSEEDQSPVLTLSNKETGNLWKLIYRDYIQHGEFLPDGGLAVVHWSNDKRYVYFDSYTSGSGGECFVKGDVRTGGKGLFRLDVQTGVVTTVLPLRDSFAGYGFSFSPTGRRLVYDTNASDMNILDIRTGDVVYVPFLSEFNSGGGYLWSPDGTQFVYSTVLDTDEEENVYSLRWVDSRSGIEQILLESTDHCYKAKEWIKESVLIIESEASKEPFGRTLIEYDLTARRIISESTATPFP
jgi:hypothetical protein